MQLRGRVGLILCFLYFTLFREQTGGKTYLDGLIIITLVLIIIRNIIANKDNNKWNLSV